MKRLSLSALLLLAPLGAALGADSETLPNSKLDMPQVQRSILKATGSTGPEDGFTVTTTGGAARSLKERAQDRVNVKDYGAKLDGSDDVVAFSAARAKVNDSGTIDVPPGNFNLSPVTGGPATPILWRMSGNKYASGSAITGIGNDVLETMYDGSKAFFKTTNTTQNRTPTLRIDHRLDYSGGTDGITVSAFKVNQFVDNQLLSDYAWSNSTTLISSARGPGQHVATASQAVRPANALSDGRGPRAQLWGLYTEARDNTNQGSAQGGSMVGHELDLYLNGADPGNHRILLQLAFARSVQSGPKARVGKGITLGSNDSYLGYGPSDWSHLGTGIEVTSGWDVAAVDTSTGFPINGAPAIKLGGGQVLAFDGSTDGYNRGLTYGGGLLAYKVQGISVFTLTDAGRGYFQGGINIPDQAAPISTSDPAGNVGDIRYSGQYIYRKTTSDWLRYSGSTL